MNKEEKKRLKMEKFKKKMENFQKKHSSPSTSTTNTSTTNKTTGYNPMEIEEKWYKIWEEKELFKPRKGGEKFVITMPPPNVTGSLHIGHSMMIAIQDCLVRFKRMQGYEVLYLPGTDHAGIATQSVVSKKLQREGREVDREGFLEAAWEWKEKYGGRIINQFKRLGASADFSREKFTMDEEMSEAVVEAFVRLHERGMIYREAKIVNWCSKLKTTLSDLEVNHETVKANSILKVDEGEYEFGVIYHIRYPIRENGSSIEKDLENMRFNNTSSSGFLEVYTTRPETILGDVALCANPKDERYSNRKIIPINPLTGEEIEFYYDEQAQMDFGTGLLKITPAHDPVDFEIFRRHSTSTSRSIFDEDNRVTVEGPLFGLKRFEARKKAVEILQERGLFVKKIPYEQTIPVCSRSGDIIEPTVKEQWWMRCGEMAKKAMEVVRSGEISIHPPEATKIWNHWLGNIRDWCLSRQLWWGHRIPAYRTSCGRWTIGRSREEAIEKHQRETGCKDCTVVQDEDVLDTWFSSGLWPFATVGWPTKDMDYFPSSILETGSDILFFWVARMVMLSVELVGQVPFSQILLHGIVRDAHGRKMSKSLGNVIDPIFVIEGSSLESLISTMKSGNLSRDEVSLAEDTLKKDFPRGIPQCGADALRFTLLSYTLGMKDINLDILRVEGYRRLCNKLWNASKYISTRVENGKVAENGKDGSSNKGLIDISSTTYSNTPATSWILKRRNSTVESSISNLEKFNFMQATQIIHQFFLYDFCDVFIEISKNDPSSQCLLLPIFLDILRIFHPYLPFITEELYFGYTGESIMYSPYPKVVGELLESSSTNFSVFLDFVKLLRSKTPKTIRIKKSSFFDETYLGYLRSLIKKTEIILVEDSSTENWEMEGELFYQIE